jgi:hypothetical protein
MISPEKQVINHMKRKHPKVEECRKPEKPKMDGKMVKE